MEEKQEGKTGRKRGNKVGDDKGEKKRKEIVKFQLNKAFKYANVSLIRCSIFKNLLKSSLRIYLKSHFFFNYKQ